MSLAEKLVYLIAAVLALLIAGYVAAYFWTSRVPARPSDVRADAAFLWAPAVGIPAPRRGDWIACWQESTYIFCQLNDIDGKLEYKGEFVSYPQKRPIPPAPWRIDPEKTRDDKVWIGEALVPLVYLQSGEIFVPVSKYEESVSLLHQRGRTR